MNGEDVRAEWLVPGAEVVVLAGHYSIPSPVLNIERVMKRDVVLSNGDRWSLTRLAPNGSHITKRSNSTWDPATALFPADHPKVAEARRAATERGVKNRCAAIGGKVTDAIRAEDWDEARRLHGVLGHWLTSAPDAPFDIEAASHIGSDAQ